MLVFYTVKAIQDYLFKQNAKSVGFVPTMGALHQAHLSLIHTSKQENELTVCSIFVNPKQFNQQADLDNYPRNVSVDLKTLETASCDVVFIPSVAEMYPQQVEKNFNFGILSEVMEAAYRPGHFNGVAIVVERFFEILNPTRAYFGEKDFQQLAVVKALVKQLKLPVKIVSCPTLREANGLAMSSRNERLSETEKEQASAINKALQYVSKHRHQPVSVLKAYFSAQMKQHENFKLEYFEIADAETLQPIENWEKDKKYVAFAAVNVGPVRLIDNVPIIP